MNEEGAPALSIKKGDMMMRTFRVTIEIDETTTTEKTVRAEGLGDLLSKDLRMSRRDKETGVEYVIPASRIVEILEVLGKGRTERVY